jgi:hypothetical protein
LLYLNSKNKQNALYESISQSNINKQPSPISIQKKEVKLAPSFRIEIPKEINGYSDYRESSKSTLHTERTSSGVTERNSISLSNTFSSTSKV